MPAGRPEASGRRQDRRPRRRSRRPESVSFAGREGLRYPARSLPLAFMLRVARHCVIFLEEQRSNGASRRISKIRERLRMNSSQCSIARARGTRADGMSSFRIFPHGEASAIVAARCQSTTRGGCCHERIGRFGRIEALYREDPARGPSALVRRIACRAEMTEAADIAKGPRGPHGRPMMAPIDVDGAPPISGGDALGSSTVVDNVGAGMKKGGEARRECDEGASHPRGGR